MPDASSSNRPEPRSSFDMLQLGKRTKQKNTEENQHTATHDFDITANGNRMLCGFQRNNSTCNVLAH